MVLLLVMVKSGEQNPGEIRMEGAFDEADNNAKDNPKGENTSGFALFVGKTTTEDYNNYVGKLSGRSSKR